MPLELRVPYLEKGRELGMCGHIVEEWDRYIEGLRNKVLLQCKMGDQIIWGGRVKEGQVITLDTYMDLIMKKKRKSTTMVVSKAMEVQSTLKNDNFPLASMEPH